MEIGDKIVLTGISRHGKQRIDQHGNPWTVTGKGTFNGHPALRMTSERESFSIGHGKKIKDNRWVFLKEDPNFYWNKIDDEELELELHRMEQMEINTGRF